MPAVQLVRGGEWFGMFAHGHVFEGEKCTPNLLALEFSLLSQKLFAFRGQLGMVHSTLNQSRNLTHI